MKIFPSLLSFILIFSLTFVFTSGTVPGASHPECEFASTCWSNNYIKDHSCVSLPEGGAIINSTHIEIGISAVLSGGDAQWEIATNAATLLAIEEINNSNDILPGITIIPTFADDAALYIQGFLAGLCLSKRGVPVILGPTYSDAMGAAVIAARQNVPMLSPTCSTPKVRLKGEETRPFRYPPSPVAPARTLMTRYVLRTLSQLDNRDPENGFPLFTRTFISKLLKRRMENC